jgi:hypothetical protein
MKRSRNYLHGYQQLTEKIQDRVDRKFEKSLLILQQEKKGEIVGKTTSSASVEKK